MRRFVHISDLHFGAADERVAEALAEDIRAERPDRAVVSGDLTQRAKPGQFEQAKAFLESLGCPVLVVPGNHDLVPLFSPLRRMLAPLSGFRRHLGHHPDSPEDEIAVAVGMNSARPMRWKEGRIDGEELRRARILTAGHRGDDRVRVAFLHHPKAAEREAAALSAIGIDLVLAGHAHTAGVRLLHSGGRSLVLSQVGTSCSTRLRGSANSYGVVTISRGNLRIEHRFWEGGAFEPGRRFAFGRDADGGWAPSHP